VSRPRHGTCSCHTVLRRSLVTTGVPLDVRSCGGGESPRARRHPGGRVAGSSRRTTA
jgi:hypothetical protein